MRSPNDLPDDRSTATLPKAVRLAWGIEEPGTRGPRKGLSLERVVDAAIEVADAEGLAGLSMSRVAKQLGFTTMSLYRYVDSKDDLVELMADRAIGQPSGLVVSGGWRDRLESWALGEYRAVRAHTWWPELTISAPPTGPNNLAWLEAGLRAVSDTGLAEDRKLQVVLNVSLFVIGRARFALDLERSAGVEQVDYSRMLPLLLDEARFPALRAAIEGGAFDSGDADDAHWLEHDFRFGLDRMLDGIERFTGG
ncbi:TetR/AcrR family transcriptional regulator [Rhodococcus koreensis]